MGTGRDSSWPRQLGEILSDRFREENFEVINLGTPSAPAAYLVPTFIEKFKDISPDVVITMMGMNESPPIRFLRRSLPERLGLIKGQKAATGVSIHKDFNFSEGEELNETLKSYILEGDLGWEKLKEDVEKIVLRYPAREWYICSVFSKKIRRWRKVAQARGAAEEAADQVTPALIYSYELSHRAVLCKADNSVVLNRLLNSFNDFKLTEAVDFYWFKTRDAIQYSIKNGLWPRPELLIEIAKFNRGRDPVITAFLRSHRMESSGLTEAQVIIKNFRKLADFLSRRQVPLFLMQYPTGKVEGLRNLFAAQPKEFRNLGSLYGMKDAPPVKARYRHLKFTSNENFNSVVSPDNYLDYFMDVVQDRGGCRFGHLTEKGHRLVAENAYESLCEILKTHFGVIGKTPEAQIHIGGLTLE
jgi:hypothetical protein